MEARYEGLAFYCGDITGSSSNASGDEFFSAFVPLSH